MDNMTASTWDGPPGDIIGDLKKVTEKVQEIRERYDNYTHIYITKPAWDLTREKLGIEDSPTPYLQLYGLPLKVFNSFEEMCVALITVPIAARILMVSLDNEGHLYSLSLAEIMGKYGV